MVIALVKIDEVYENILIADKVLKNIVYHTPLDHSHTLSRITGGKVFLKLENLQRTSSFKIRGAYYTINKLLRSREINLCVAASSGNHAQGVALASTLHKLKSIIVMPEYTPITKIMATRRYGGKVVLYGKSYDEAYAKAVEICEKERGVFIHPFNDYNIIAGQGTIGLEIFRDLSMVDVVIVPIGGGGLIAGIATALKRLRPSVKIIGVQPKGSPAMYKSFKNKRLMKSISLNTIADGVAVKSPGEKPFEIILKLVDDIFLVEEDDIVRALFLLLERSKCVAEPAGALSVALLLSGQMDVKNKRVVALISGGNIDPDLLIRVVNRALILEGRRVKIKGIVPDRPGILREVLDTFTSVKANIITIDHDRSSIYLKPNETEVTITLELPKPEKLDIILKNLKKKGFYFQKYS